MGVDEDRFCRFLNGDDAAFCALLGDYQGRVYAIITRRGGFRGDEVEDLFQEVWLRVIKHASTFDPQTCFRAWLYAIVRNACVDYIRATVRREQHVRELIPIGGDDSADDGADPLEQFPDAGPSPYASSLRNQFREALVDCRERMGEDRLGATIKLYAAGLPQREMAEQLGVSLGTVNTWFHQACDRLRRCLERKGWTGLDNEEVMDGGGMSETERALGRLPLGHRLDGRRCLKNHPQKR